MKGKAKKGRYNCWGLVSTMMTTKMERIDFLYFALFWVGLFNAGKYEIFCLLQLLLIVCLA